MRSCVRTMRWLSPQCSIHQSQKLFSLSLCVCVCLCKTAVFLCVLYYVVFKMNWLAVASGRCEWDVHDFQMGRIYIIPKELTFVLSFSFLVLSSSLIPFSIRQNEICKSVFIPRCTIHLISINFVGTRNAVLPPQPPSQHENTIQAKRTNFEIWNTNLFADVVCGVPSTRFTRNSSNSFTNSQSIEMHPKLFQLIFRFSFLLFSLLQNYNYRKRIDWEIHVLFKLCYKYCSFGICHTSIFATYKFSTIVIYSTIQRNRITNWYEQRVLCVRVDWWPILNWWTHLNYKNRKIQFFRLPKRMKILTHHHRRRDASTIHTHKRLHALRCAYPIGRACVSTLCERMKHTKCVCMCVRWERERARASERVHVTISKFALVSPACCTFICQNHCWPTVSYVT